MLNYKGSFFLQEKWDLTVDALGKREFLQSLQVKERKK